MNDERFYIPKYLDEPPRWLFWTLDEAIALLAPLMLGLLVLDSFLLGACAGGVLMMIIKKLKGREGHHFLLSFAYWHLPLGECSFKATPPSYQRNYLG